MSHKKPQSFAHHARFEPVFHFFLAPVFLANLVDALVELFRHYSLHRAWIALLSAAALLFLGQMRRYSLQVQDRVIRLEERVRLLRLAPAGFEGRIDQLSVDQMIGLRFASDGEVVALAEQALAENLNRKQIKQRVQVWRPDYDRL